MVTGCNVPVNKFPDVNAANIDKAVGYIQKFTADSGAYVVNLAKDSVSHFAQNQLNTHINEYVDTSKLNSVINIVNVIVTDENVKNMLHKFE